MDVVLATYGSYALLVGFPPCLRHISSFLRPTIFITPAIFTSLQLQTLSLSLNLFLSLSSLSVCLSVCLSLSLSLSSSLVAFPSLN